MVWNDEKCIIRVRNETSDGVIVDIRIGHIHPVAFRIRRTTPLNVVALYQRFRSFQLKHTI
jgi:hypothetical protein